eukprot:7559862-Alexandrium_andersonii.AAC.1
MARRLGQMPGLLHVWASGARPWVFRTIRQSRNACWGATASGLANGPPLRGLPGDGWGGRRLGLLRRSGRGGRAARSGARSTEGLPQA